MLLIFTCIYASGYSERDFEEEPFFILATPALSTPAFCYIGYKMAVRTFFTKCHKVVKNKSQK